MARKFVVLHKQRVKISERAPVYAAARATGVFKLMLDEYLAIPCQGERVLFVKDGACNFSGQECVCPLILRKGNYETGEEPLMLFDYAPIVTVLGIEVHKIAALPGFVFDLNIYNAKTVDEAFAAIQEKYPDINSVDAEISVIRFSANSTYLPPQRLDSVL